MKIGLVAEHKLETMIRERVATLKEHYPCWRDPEQLCKELGIQVEYGSVGLGREGAAFADAIKLDPTAGVAARRNFTFYHEIVHHVLRNHEELYSIINDQYETDELFRTIKEKLCNVGAAEFLLPRAIVNAAYKEEGFSVTLIDQLSQPGVISRVAVCAQLAFCAPHACIGVVCRRVRAATPTGPIQAPEENPDSPNVRTVIDAAFSSSSMKYTCGTGTMLPTTHFLSRMFGAQHGERQVQSAPIPFKSGRQWSVECEAVRLGEQVFAFFHKAAPPTSVRDQLRLPF